MRGGPKAQGLLLDLPLTFTTVPVVEGQPRPYDDEVDESGLIRYRYRGSDPGHRDNAGLHDRHGAAHPANLLVRHRARSVHHSCA
jgi:hypothetical protein